MEGLREQGEAVREDGGEGLDDEYGRRQAEGDQQSPALRSRVAHEMNGTIEVRRA